MRRLLRESLISNLVASRNAMVAAKPSTNEL